VQSVGDNLPLKVHLNSYQLWLG